MIFVPRTIFAAALLMLSGCGPPSKYAMFAHRVKLPLESIEESDARRPALVCPTGSPEVLLDGRRARYRIDVQNVNLVCQRTPDTCWAAAGATLLNYMGYPFTREHLVSEWERLYGHGCTDCSKVSERKQIERVTYGTIPDSVSINDEDEALDGIIDNRPFDPVQYLVNGLPFLWLFRSEGSGAGHAYVVTGATYIVPPRGRSLVESFQVLDPNCEEGKPPTTTLSAKIIREGISEVIALRPIAMKDRPRCEVRP
jgi:hypothetical protein